MYYTIFAIQAVKMYITAKVQQELPPKSLFNGKGSVMYS